MLTTLRGAILTLLALLLTSCTFWGGDTTVRVSSTPAGAYIFLDGEDTGETTPALLDLGKIANLDGFIDSDRVVTIRKKGYEPERRILHHHSSVYTSKWIDGATTAWSITNPIFWTFGDFFTPFGAHWTYVPNELHVKLYPEGEAPGK